MEFPKTLYAVMEDADTDCPFLNTDEDAHDLLRDGEVAIVATYQLVKVAKSKKAVTLVEVAADEKEAE